MDFLATYIIIGILTSLFHISSNNLNWRILTIFPVIVVIWPVLVIYSVCNDIYEIKCAYQHWRHYKNEK